MKKVLFSYLWLPEGCECIAFPPTTFRYRNLVIIAYSPTAATLVHDNVVVCNSDERKSLETISIGFWFLGTWFHPNCCISAVLFAMKIFHRDGDILIQNITIIELVQQNSWFKLQFSTICTFSISYIYNKTSQSSRVVFLNGVFHSWFGIYTCHCLLSFCDHS